MSLGFRFTNAQHIIKISSIYLIILIGNSLASTFKVLTYWITCSTNMCMFAIFFVLISSDGTIWYVPLFPCGMYNEWLYNKLSFSILKPLSAFNSWIHW